MEPYFLWVRLQVSNSTPHPPAQASRANTRYADLHATQNSCETALHGAAWLGHLDIVKLLLQSGADLHMKDNFGWTALCSARSGNKQEVVAFLEPLMQAMRMQ